MLTSKHPKECKFEVCKYREVAKRIVRKDLTIAGHLTSSTDYMVDQENSVAAEYATTIPVTHKPLHIVVA